MSMPSIVCGTCQAPVPYGRLSCPACGELLASVAGAGRRMGITVLPSPGFDADPDEVEAGDAVAEVAPPAPIAKPASRKRAAAMVAAPVATLVPDPGESWDADPAVDDADDPAEDPAAAIASSAVEPTADDAPEPPVVAAAPVRPSIAAVAAAAAVTPRVEPPPIPVEPTPPPVEQAPPPVPVRSTTMAPLRDDSRPQPPVLTDVAAPVWPADLPQPAPVAVPDPTPGAYVPPSPVITAGPALPAREYAGANGGPTGAAAAALASDASAARDETGRLDALDPAKVAEFIDWMAVAGAALAAVGFVLPWSVTVIGSSGVDYFERWGLAGPGHPLIVTALLAILVLAILHNPIPAWIRVGIAGLAVGSFLLGMLWPYVVGPLGALPGAIASLVGTVVLLGAASVALIVHRHATSPRGV